MFEHPIYWKGETDLEKADIIFTNGTIITMDEGFPFGEALAICKENILAVGDFAKMADFKGEETKVIDLKGKTLLPGFNDSHLHMLGFGITLISVRLQGLRSIREVKKRVLEKVEQTAPGEWITGAGWDQNLYEEKRYPNRYDLDEVAPDHPVAFRHVSGHALLVNSKAIELAGIDKDTVPPTGGEIDLDEQEKPTGVLRETAEHLVSPFYYPYPEEKAKEALKLAMKKAVSSGITSVSDNSTAGVIGGYPVYLKILEELWEEESPMVRSAQYFSDEEIDQVVSEGIQSGDGDEKVRIGGIKIFSDGSFMAQTAAMREPFSDDPENKGFFMQSQKELEEKVMRSHENELQVAVHSIGDAGIDASLDAIEKALNKKPKDNHRHRIVHFEILTEDILERAKKLGVVADIQPKFVSTQGGWVEDRVGPQRAKLTFAWKTVLDKGIPCGGSSDCPVEPLEPLWGIHAAVNRQVDSVPGMVFNPYEALTVYEALSLFTKGSAYTTFEEHRKGMIRPDYLADLVVLSENPLEIPKEKIRDIDIEMTVIGGKIYQF